MQTIDNLTIALNKLSCEDTNSENYFWIFNMQWNKVIFRASGYTLEPEKCILIATIKDNSWRFMIPERLINILLSQQTNTQQKNHLNAATYHNVADSFDIIITKQKCIPPFNRVDPEYIPDVFWILSYDEFKNYLKTFESDFSSHLFNYICNYGWIAPN